MAIALIAVVRRVIHDSGVSAVPLTSVDLVYPDGRDCGVPLFVEGYEGTSELLTKLGVTSQELERHRAKFEQASEVRISLVADAAVVRDMGFNPRELQSREL